MSVRRWLTRVGIVVGLAVLGGAGLVVTPLVWPGDPDDSIRTVAGRQVGEATGHVVSLDSEAGVLKISSNILGLRPVAFAIESNTPITVGQKQGGLGDLAIDTPLRVVYELDGQKRRARLVEVVVPGAASRADAASSVLSTPSTDAGASAPVEAPRRVDAEPPARPAAPIDLVPKRPRAPASAATAPVTAPSPRRVEHSKAATPARPPVEDEKAIEAAAARRGSAASTAPRSTDDVGRADGTAAIDWLLGTRQR